MLIHIYLLLTAVMSVITYAVYGIDKFQAIKHRYRIPESILLILSLCGGSIGAIVGMLSFHHKTRKLKFQILVPLTIILWILFGIYVIAKAKS